MTTIKPVPRPNKPYPVGTIVWTGRFSEGSTYRNNQTEASIHRYIVAGHIPNYLQKLGFRYSLQLEWSSLNGGRFFNCPDNLTAYRPEDVHPTYQDAVAAVMDKVNQHLLNVSEVVSKLTQVIPPTKP